jgi:hypothetical protein
MELNMKVGRRSVRAAAKSTLTGPVSRRLNSRERDEQKAKPDVAKAQAKPPRPSYGLETVEPRLLMSADLSYTTLNDTLTLAVGGTAAAPTVKLSDASGQLASVNLTTATGAEVDISRTGTGGGAVSADTLNIDLTNFSTLNSFVNANGGQLTVKFIGGDEEQGTPHPFTDTVNVNGTSGALPYGVTIDSTSVIYSAANLTAQSITLASAQTASDLLSTGLFANADTGIGLTGAHLTATGGALTLNATSTLAVSTNGAGISAVNGAVITSFSSANIGIGGSSMLSAAGGDVDITASVQGNLSANANGATVKLVSIDGSASPTVTINGNSSVVSTTGAINATASSNVTINAYVVPASGQSNAKVDAAVLNTTFGSGAAMTVNGGATLNAHGADTVAASSTLNSSTLASANVAGDAGASVAVSVITGDTTTDVDNASLTGSSVSATASSNRTIVTTANSAPGGSQASGNGSNASEQTLANNNASTGSGQNITVAGAITVSTDTGKTSAFLGNGAKINAGAGAATVSAASVDVVTLTATGQFTQAGTNGVGVGVAINVADRPDSAYVTGTVSVTAASLDVAVLAPSQSTFTLSATSGVGNSSNVGFAGALAVNVVVLDHEAYLDTNAALTLPSGHTATTFESHSNIANSVKALPANGGTAASVGIGASFALNDGQDTNQATIGNGAALTGASNLSLTAAGAHTMLTDATAGGAGATGITPVVAISIADDDNAATLGTGALLTIGGALVASSTLSNTVSTNAAGDTKSSKTGVGISLAMSFVNDHSTATTGRDITSTGAMSFLSTTTSGSESFATASVVGAAQDNGSGQSVDSTANSQQGFANSTATSKDSKAKGTEGANPPSASTSDGQVSVAAGIAINDEQSTSQAYIADGRTITAGGILTVKSGAKVDGQASTSGSAVTNATTFAPAAVSTTADTINLGSSTTLKTGDGVTYYNSNGTPIGGLTNGTKYYVNVVSGGTIKLYDTAADAQAGGTTGLMNMTSQGTGTQYLTGGGSTGTSVGAAVSVNFVKDTNLAYLGGSTFKVAGLDVEATTPAQTISFDPSGGVSVPNNTINLGVTDLVTGDAVTYNTNGGTAIGGLTNGKTYYVNVQTNGTVKLYDSYADAVAAGATGLMTLTSVGSGAATMVSSTDNFGAYAISGAGGGKTGVAGSLAISISDDDTEADLGYTQPASSPGVPVITVTGGANVTLNAQTSTAVSASAVPSNGGGTGANLGVGISVSLDYAQTQTLAQITNGVGLTGANNVTMTATSLQTMTTQTNGGSSGSTGITPVIAIAITDNNTEATLGTGAAIGVTGSFSATASLTDTVIDSAIGATQASDTGVGITVTVTVVNDNALATTGRGLTSSGASSPITFSATALSSSSSNATASVAGGQQSSGSSGQSVNNTTGTQSGYGDSEVKNSDSSAMGTQGSDSNNKAQSGNGSVSVAGAVAVNVEDGTAKASVADGVTITTKGMLSVVTVAQVNGLAIASGAATTSSGGTGVGLGVAVNVANVTNQATIGNGTTISSGGLTVGANMGQRTIPLATTSVPVVDTTMEGVFLGLGTGLTTGTAVKYNAMGGTAIGGLTDGTTYYLNNLGNGYFTLYVGSASAMAGGTSGRLNLTSTGSGTQEFTQSQFEGLVTNNFTFNTTGNVTLLTGLGLHTGDAVAYSSGGGTNMGGLSNGTTYYVIALNGGQYQLASSLDNALAGTAITLGAAGSSSTQSFVDKTDNFRADATSGASGGDIGVSVSVGVNDVSNNTSASVGDSAALAAPKVTISGGGAVSVTASSYEQNFARALPSAGGASGSSVGVGGSVGVNVVSNITVATIIDGTTWAGSAGAVTVTAISSDTVFTHGENGASGGSAAVGIGAAVAVVSDTTTAYVGTGSAIAAAGNVTITASDTGIFETTTNASAAGSSVAVGASVSVDVVNENVTAQTARSITTTSGTMSIMAITSIEDQTLATASTGGESSSDSQQNSNGKSGADGQADKQINGNSDTGGSSLPSSSSNVSGANSDSSGQGGGDGGGVGVAASVAVGVLTVNNAATVSSGVVLSATGAVTIEASAGITDKTQAVGSSVALSSSTEVGAGVAVAVVNTTNNAEVGASSITGAGITIEAITPSTDTFVVWAASAAGGTGSASVAGSVAVNVVNTDNNQASASGATLKSGAGITVQATNSLSIQTLAAAGAFSDGAGVGVAVTVGYLRVNSTAFITGNANAAGATVIDSKVTLTQLGIVIPKNPVPLPSATAIAVVGAAGTSPTVAGSVIVDDFGLNSSAYIGPSSFINRNGYYAATSSQTVSVTAENTTPITAIAGALSATTGAAGVGASLDLELINKSTTAYIGANSRVSAGGAVTVTATSSETMLSVTATLGVGDDAGVAATASIAPISPTTEAYIDAGALVSAGGAMTITATETFITTMIAGSVGVGGTAGVGAANTTLVYTPTTLAYAGTGANLSAGGGGLSIVATQSENVLAITAGIAAGGTAGVAGSATVAVLNDTTTAYVGAGSTVSVTGGGSLGVAASDTTGVISVAGNLAVGGTVGAGVGADVGVYTKHTNAYIGSGVVATVTGNIFVIAQSSENLISVAAGIAGGTVGVGIDAGVHVFSLQTRAFIGDDPNAPANKGAGNVLAVGSVAIAANDASDINEIVGVFAAGAVGVAAGAGVNVFTKDTEAFIGAGARVTGQGNDPSITVDTGQIGVSYGATTSSFTPTSQTGNQGINASSSSTMTNALNSAQSGNRSSFTAAGTVGTPSLGSMDLTGSGAMQSPGSGNQSLSSTTGNRQTSVGTAGGFTGVAVGATNQDEIRTFTVTLGVGSVAVAVSAGVDVVNATTQAYIGASANVAAGPGASASVVVGATDDFYHLSVGAGLAFGAVGVAPSVGVNVITDTTNASIGNSATVNATGGVSVTATGSENILLIGVGLAAGAVGVGAVVDVLSISNQTTASIGSAAIVHAGGNVLVAALDNSSVFELSGALAGGFVGVGGAVGVMLITKVTDATIGANANVEGLGNGAAASGILNGVISGGAFQTVGANGVLVQAQSGETILQIVAAGGVGFVGVSGAVGVASLNITTNATVGSGAVINHYNPAAANGNQSVFVDAADNFGFQVYVIGVAGGFVGVTGAVDVGTLADNIAAVVDTGAIVYAKQSVDVGAAGLQSLTGYVISGAGGFVGAGASVMDWSIGQALQTNYSDNSGHSANGLVNGSGNPDNNAGQQSQTGTSLVTGSGGIGGLTTSSPVSANSSAGRINSATGSAGGMVNSAAPTQSSVLAMQTATPVNPGTSAVVQSGAQVHAGGAIGIIAEESATVSEFLGQVAGGVVGIGAAVDILSFNDNVQASDDATNTAGGDVFAYASLNSGINITALDLSAGFVGVGAGVVVVTDNSVVKATLGSVSTPGNVSVTATSTQTITITTGQASIGAVGAGATFTEITMGGSTTAAVDVGALIGSLASKVGSLSVDAVAVQDVSAQTTAVTAGIGSFGANFTTVNVDPTIDAAVGANAVIDVSGAVSVIATSTTDADANTFGVSAGGLSVGVSFTDVTVAPTITAEMDNGVNVSAGSVNVGAASYLPAGGWDATATATGSAGALIGVVSTNTQASNNDVVTSFIGSSAKIAVLGAVVVTALNYTAQKTSSDSNAGGLVAVGLATSQSNSNTTTNAYIGTSTHITSGDFKLTATGDDNNSAHTNAGSGGLVAGSSAESDTTNNSTTTATVGASDVIVLSDTTVSPTTGFIVYADHEADFNAQISTFAGGLFAGSGGTETNNVTAHTTATVGSSAMVAAYNISVTAYDFANKPPLPGSGSGSVTPNIYGTTGGLVSAATASDVTTINFTTVVYVSPAAFLNALGTESNDPILQLEASNNFNIYDDVAFETGGAFAGAGATATINVPTDIAKVEVGSGAALQSQGAILITSRGGGSFDEELQTDTYGLGTYSGGTTTVNVTVTNQVLVDANVLMTSYGNLDLGAGTDVFPNFDTYQVTTHNDGYAYSAVPISNVNANAFLSQNNSITIASGALLKTAQEVYITAQPDRTANMVSYADAINWATGLANGILSALGGGSPIIHGGTSKTTTTSSVVNNGTVQTGINSHLSLTLNDNANWTSSNPISQAVTAAPGASPQITFTVDTEVPVSPLFAALQYDEQQLAEYGAENTALYNYYSGEVTRIESLLESQGLLTFENNGTAVVQLSNAQPELVVTINPVYADAGVIYVHSDTLTGTGTFIAPNSATVTILNNSLASLVLYGIQISADQGGLWYNIGPVTSNSTINGINGGGSGANFNLNNVANGPAATPPAIVIENTLNINTITPPAGVPLQWPSITLLSLAQGGIGITNPNGSLLIEEVPPSQGNITLDGPVNVGTQTIITAGTLVITGVTDEEVGGAAYAAWNAITQGAYVGAEAGQTAGGVGPASQSAINTLLSTPASQQSGLHGASITINAEYIDIDGVIQSGSPEFDLTINPTVTAEIDTYLALGYTGMIYLPEESNDNFTVDYDTATKQIDVTAVPVNGGYVNLTGHIMNALSGTIEVFGGYGSINITNNTNYDIAVQNLDASTPGQGQLIINDLYTQVSNGQTTTVPNFSEYTYSPGNDLITWENNPGGSAPTTYTGINSNTTTFAPQAGWRYGWTTVDQEEVTKQYLYTTSDWIGIIPTGSAVQQYFSVVALATPRVSPTGGYFFYEPSLTPGASNYQLNQSANTYTTNSGSVMTLAHSESSTWYGEHTYSALFQELQGQETDYYDDVSASNPITVSFSGGSEAVVTVTSTGTGNIYLDGAINNPVGFTVIDAEQGSIFSEGPSQVLTGGAVYLYSAGAIGTATAPVNIVAQAKSEADANIDNMANTGGITAIAKNGGIYLNAPTGSMYIAEVQAITYPTDYNGGQDNGIARQTYTGGGDVVLTAADNILPTGYYERYYNQAVLLLNSFYFVPNNSYSGLVEGGAISLTASFGEIGDSTTAEIQINTPQQSPGLVDTITATAAGNVFLQQNNGNMEVNSISTTGGDVWLNVPYGSVLNANTTSTTDTRTEEQLIQGVWSDLGLTDATGYAQTLDTTLASFASAQDAEYQAYWQDIMSGATSGAAFTQLQAIFGVGGTYAAQDPGYNPLVYDGSAALISAPVYFTPGTASTGGTITRTDGASWITQGFAVGQAITITGTTTDATPAGQTYEITGITASTITLATQDTVVAYGTAAAPKTVTLQHNTTDSQDAVKGYFTASTATVPGAITRTDGGNWLTDGFAVGQTILVAGSSKDSTQGSTAYTVTAVSATMLTLSLADTIVAEATAAAPEAFKVQHIFAYKMTAAQTTTLTSHIRDWTPAELLNTFNAGLLKSVTDTVITVGAPNITGGNVTILAAYSVGEQISGAVTIPLSYPPNAPTVLTSVQSAALAAAERVDVQYLAGSPITAKVNFTANTITRTDGGNWAGLSVGEYLSVLGANGNYTQNETDGTLFYKIDAINGATLTIDSSTPIPAVEQNISVTVAPVVLDPLFQATAAPAHASVYFTPNTATAGGTITRTDGQSWITQGFAVGDLVEIAGSANNSTSPDVPDVITAVTATTLTLTPEDLVVSEGTAAAPETITVTLGVTPKPVAIEIAQINPIQIEATGIVNITASQSVFVDSTVDVRIGQVTAGTTSVGSQIQIKTKSSITDGQAGATSPTPNLQGGEIVLEASGQNGDPGIIGTASDPIRVASIGTGTITARAQGSVNLSGVIVQVTVNQVTTNANAGNLNIETVYSATGDANLSAQGSILSALDNGFTTIEAHNVTLTAEATIGNIVNGAINYVYLDNLGTVKAIAYQSIWVSEGDLILTYEQNLNLVQAYSFTGGVTLRAGLSILDASGTPGTPEIEGSQVTLTSLFGGIGLISDVITIFNATVLTASAGMGDIHIQVTGGDVTIASIVDASGSVYLGDETGSILNGAAAGVTDIVAKNAALGAEVGIGSSATKRVTTQVGSLEALSATGDTLVDNTGALTIGGSFYATGVGADAGGNVIITATGALTVENSIIAKLSIELIAQNAVANGNITIDGLDLLTHPLLVEAGGAVLMYAGDGITVQQQAAVKAGTGVLLQSDYQGNLNGVTPANPGPSIFVTTGTAIQIAGLIAAPYILIRGGDGPDKITATGTSVLTAAFPWTSATYPTQFGTFPATPTTVSVLQVYGYAGNDTISLAGSLTAQNVNIVGGDGADTINFSPTNAQTGVDVIFGDNGTVTYAAPAIVTGITTTDDGNGGNDTITVGSAANPAEAILFGGEGTNTISMSNGQGDVFGGDGSLAYTATGALTTITSVVPDLVGNDTLNLGAASVIAFGGSGNSTINAGQGSSFIFGHEGQAYYGATGGPIQFIRTIDPTDGTSTKITVSDALADTNIIMGGNGAGTITVGNGADTIIGHNGQVTFSGRNTASVISQFPADGGNETITMGYGSDIVIGGSGSNTITGTTGNKIVVGDNATIQYDANGLIDLIYSTDVVTVGSVTTDYGGNNTIKLGNGNDLVIGGLGANSITVGNGNSSIIASDGKFSLTNNVLTAAQTLNPTLGGPGTVQVGTGRNVVIGSPGNDTITLAASNTYAVLGGPGTVNYDAAGWAKTAILMAPATAATTGTDKITIGTVTQTLSGAADILTAGLGTPQFAAAAPPAVHAAAPALTEKELEPIVVEAEAIWARVLGADRAKLAILNGITIDIGTLSDGMIGLTQGDVITIDSTADGWGWFTDTTLAGNNEFERTATPGVLTAEPGSAAAGEMDLLSTVLHEMGNAMGFPEDTGQDVTGQVLAAGQRRLPVLEGAVGVASGLPAISWGAINAADSLLPPNPGTPSWTDDFLNNLGRGASGKQPNAGFRIKLG